MITWKKWIPLSLNVGSIFSTKMCKLMKKFAVNGNTLICRGSQPYFFIVVKMYGIKAVTTCQVLKKINKSFTFACPIN